jgi:hypothetical protein
MHEKKDGLAVLGSVSFQSNESGCGPAMGGSLITSC